MNIKYLLYFFFFWEYFHVIFPKEKFVKMGMNMLKQTHS